MVKTIADASSQYNLSTDMYPLSESGPKFARRSITIISAIIILSIVAILLLIIQNPINSTAQSQLDKSANDVQITVDSSEQSSINSSESPNGTVTYDASGDLQSVDMDNNLIQQIPAIQFITKSLEKISNSVGDVSFHNSSRQLDISEFNAVAIIASINSSIYHIIIAIIKLLVIILIARMLWHLVLAVRRQRRFERHVIINDFKAALLQKSLIRALSINKQIRDFKRSKKGSKGSGGSQTMSMSDKDKLQLLRKVKQVKVFVNTRESLSQKGVINTQYRIIIELPTQTDMRDSMMKQVEAMGPSATQLTAGQVIFGEHFVADDQNHVIIRGITDSVADKYDYTELVEKRKASSSEAVHYESSYKLSNLIDHRAYNKEMSAKTSVWVEKTAIVVDSILITNKMKVTRISTIFGGSNALLIYDLAPGSAMPESKKMSERIDVQFKTTGSTMSTVNGELHVTIPLPKDLKLRLDVPTIFNELFGSPDINS